MTEIATAIAPYSPGAQPTLKEIQNRIEQLFELAPSGGSFLCFSAKYRAPSMSTVTFEEGSWRISVKIIIPARPTFFYALLAHREVEEARRSINFMLRIDDLENDLENNLENDLKNDTADGDSTPATKTRHYIVFNGDYPSSPFRHQEPNPKPFQDNNLRARYGDLYHTENFEDALNVIRSEITGEKAFND